VEVHAGIAVSKPPSMFLCFMSHSMPTSPSSRARCLQLWVGFGGWGEDSSRSRRKGRSPDFTRDKMQGGGGGGGAIPGGKQGSCDGAEVWGPSQSLTHP
jgi:hypothetical protein